MSSRGRAPSGPGYELGELAPAVSRRLDGWAGTRAGARLWQRDHRLWSERQVAEIEDRLGWLELPGKMPDLLDELEPFAERAAADDLETVVLIGMGGSSLGAEMLQAALGDPRWLRIADSTSTPPLPGETRRGEWRQQQQRRVASAAAAASGVSSSSSSSRVGQQQSHWSAGMRSITHSTRAQASHRRGRSSRAGRARAG